MKKPADIKPNVWDTPDINAEPTAPACASEEAYDP